jgi:hypothetical protein
VNYRRFSLEELEPELESNRHPIVFVRADLLPWADFGGFHSLVLTEITPTDVAVLDPALDHGPTSDLMPKFCNELGRACC